MGFRAVRHVQAVKRGRKMNSFEELWVLVAEVIQSKVSDIVYKVWLADLRPIAFDGSMVMLAINADFKRTMRSSRCLVSRWKSCWK